jgi:hypothetical protein
VVGKGTKRAAGGAEGRAVKRGKKESDAEGGGAPLDLSAATEASVHPHDTY